MDAILPPLAAWILPSPGAPIAKRSIPQQVAACGRRNALTFHCRGTSEIRLVIAGDGWRWRGD